MSMDIETPGVLNDQEYSTDTNNPPISRSRRRTALIAIVSIAAVALIVGLSVGLTKKNKNKPDNGLTNPGTETGDSNDIDNTSDSNDTPSDTTNKDDSDGGSNETTPPKDGHEESVASLVFEPNLRPFNSDILSGYTTCSTLMKDIEEAGKYFANLVINNNIKYGDEEVIALDEGMDMSAPVATEAGESSYGTNNQVDDVDEADIVKSDGTNVFLAYGNDLLWMLTSGDVMKRFSLPKMDDSFPKISHWDVPRSSMDGGYGSSPVMDQMMGGWWQPPSQRISGILLNENKQELVVIVSYYSYFEFKFIQGSMTASHVYSITDGDLVLKTSQIHKGRYQTSRLIDNEVHIVTMTDINNYPLQEALSRQNFPGMDDDQYRQTAFNQAVLILPKYSRQVLAELMADSDGAVDTDSCDRIVGLSDMVDVGTDLDKDPTSGLGLLNGFASTVSFQTNIHSPVIAGAFLPTYSLDAYVNEDYLVFAAQGWLRDTETFSYTDYTYLIQFQLDGTNAAVKPVAIGKVPGYFLNQFSIDEYQGYLRVATTIRAKWGYDETNTSWQQLSRSHSQIAVLQPNKGILTQTAVITDIGVGEDIYSVRFFQDKGFVVTFERIDPFFTIDLSDPKNPFVAGELKISGFSNYLHLIEDNQYVLAVGQDADETTGRATGLQISLFDVRDFANPRLIQKTVIEGWSYSDAQGDHLSFRYFSNTLILPVEVRNQNEGYDGFYVYNVSIDDGIVAQGKVTHATSQYMMGGCWSSDYVPSRSMVFEGRLMTMKGHTVMLSDGLVQPTEIWSLNLDEDKTNSGYDCVPWFGPWW